MDDDDLNYLGIETMMFVFEGLIVPLRIAANEKLLRSLFKDPFLFAAHYAALESAVSWPGHIVEIIRNVRSRHEKHDEVLSLLKNLRGQLPFYSATLAHFVPAFTPGIVEFSVSGNPVSAHRHGGRDRGNKAAGFAVSALPQKTVAAERLVEANRPIISVARSPLSIAPGAVPCLCRRPPNADHLDSSASSASNCSSCASSSDPTRGRNLCRSVMHSLELPRRRSLPLHS